VARAVAEIQQLSGRQFDPEVVEAFSGLDHDELVRRFGPEPAPLFAVA
jgi:response regulator RpfG family c-di-GMP phosphodiesterase